MPLKKAAAPHIVFSPGLNGGGKTAGSIGKWTASKVTTNKSGIDGGIGSSSGIGNSSGSSGSVGIVTLENNAISEASGGSEREQTTIFIASTSALSVRGKLDGQCLIAIAVRISISIDSDASRREVFASTV